MKINWQPIETAPKDGTSILIWDASGVTKVSFRKGKALQIPGWFNGNLFWCGTNAPTHWMPLPEPPTN